MNKEHRCILNNYRDILSKVNLEDLTPLLKEYKIFNRYMWKDIRTTVDMFEALPFRGPKAFGNIIEILRKANYLREAHLLEGNKFVEETVNNLYYKMSTSPLGYCLIINNLEFDKKESEAQKETKDGLRSDVDALCDFLEHIDFDVTVLRNKNASELLACVMEFSKRDFESVDSMIIIIISYGGQLDNKEVIIGNDNNHIFISDIRDIFNNRNCEQLQFKPKMFFFIYCKGERLDYGDPKCLPNESIDSSEIVMPTLSDMFIVHSRYPTQVSLKSDKGSYFCEEFITVLKDYYQIHDLETIIKLVNKNLQSKVSELECSVHVEALCGTKKIMLCKIQSNVKS